MADVLFEVYVGAYIKSEDIKRLDDVDFEDFRKRFDNNIDHKEIWRKFDDYRDYKTVFKHQYYRGFLKYHYDPELMLGVFNLTHYEHDYYNQMEITSEMIDTAKKAFYDKFAPLLLEKCGATFDLKDVKFGVLTDSEYYHDE